MTRTKVAECRYCPDLGWLMRPTRTLCLPPARNQALRNIPPWLAMSQPFGLGDGMSLKGQVRKARIELAPRVSKTRRQPLPLILKWWSPKTPPKVMFQFRGNYRYEVTFQSILSYYLFPLILTV